MDAGKVFWFIRKVNISLYVKEMMFQHIFYLFYFFTSFFFFFFFLFFNFIYLFLAALGLCCCERAFSSCGERGLLFVVVHGLLVAVASLVVEHGI